MSTHVNTLRQNVKGRKTAGIEHLGGAILKMKAFVVLVFSLAFLSSVSGLGSSVSRFEAIGCFRDFGKDPRPLPKLLADLRNDIDWYNINKTIDKCSRLANENGYQYFGIQFYGECWSGEQTRYDKNGKSRKCVAGVGKAGANYVYKLIEQGSQWAKVHSKFIEGDVISEVSFSDQLSIASMKCKQQCLSMVDRGCKAVRLYDPYIGLVFCTFFRTVTDYRCPHDSMDVSCQFATGESWEMTSSK